MNTIPIWALALLIFCFRVTDVSVGTLRTISVVQGRLTLSVVLGFFEVLVWAVAVTQVISRLDESLLLLVAYAGGFATGNAVGILLERKLAMGTCVVRFISSGEGGLLTSALRGRGQAVTYFTGRGRGGEVGLLYIVCRRRELPALLAAAMKVDPQVFYVVEPVQSVKTMTSNVPFPHATGWRAVFKKK